MVVEEEVLVVAEVVEVVGGEWENVSHRLLILPSPPHSVGPVGHFAASLHQNGMLHKSQTNRVSKS